MEAIEKKKAVVDVDEVVKYMVKRHQFYAQCISEEKLRGYVCEVLKHHKIQPKISLPLAQVPVPTFQSVVKSIEPSNVDQGKTGLLPLSKETINSKNLNKLQDEELKKVKEVMDIDFKKNQVKKEDPGFQYDVKKDFGTPKEKSDWDSDSDEKPSNPKAVAVAPVPVPTDVKTVDVIPKTLVPLQKELPQLVAPLPVPRLINASNPPLGANATPEPTGETPNTAQKLESKPVLASEEPKKPKPKNEIDALLDTFEKPAAGILF
jgi:hypothetical protein